MHSGQCKTALSISTTSNTVLQVMSSVADKHQSTVFLTDTLNNSYHNAFLAAKSSPGSNNRDWYIDSGCTDHLISDFSSFKDYTPMKGSDIQGIAGSVPIEGKGTATK